MSKDVTKLRGMGPTKRRRVQENGEFRIEEFHAETGRRRGELKRANQRELQRHILVLLFPFLCVSPSLREILRFQLGSLYLRSLSTSSRAAGSFEKISDQALRVAFRFSGSVGRASRLLRFFMTEV